MSEGAGSWTWFLGRGRLKRPNPPVQRAVRPTAGRRGHRFGPGVGVKIGCRCGATISDSTDSLSHKAHLTPDQDLYGVWEGIDEEVIDRVASGELAVRDAYMKSRRMISTP